MPQNSQQLPSEINRDVEMIEEVKTISTQATTCSPSEDIVEVIPGTSNSSSSSRLKTSTSLTRGKTPCKMIDFNVHYESNVYPIKISESATLGMFVFFIIITTKNVLHLFLVIR